MWIRLFVQDIFTHICMTTYNVVNYQKWYEQVCEIVYCIRWLHVMWINAPQWKCLKDKREKHWSLFTARYDHLEMQVNLDETDRIWWFGNNNSFQDLNNSRVFCPKWCTKHVPNLSLWQMLQLSLTLSFFFFKWWLMVGKSCSCGWLLSSLAFFAITADTVRVYIIPNPPFYGLTFMWRGCYGLSVT